MGELIDKCIMPCMSPAFYNNIILHAKVRAVVPSFIMIVPTCINMLYCPMPSLEGSHGFES